TPGGEGGAPGHQDLPLQYTISNHLEVDVLGQHRGVAEGTARLPGIGDAMEVDPHLESCRPIGVEQLQGHGVWSLIRQWDVGHLEATTVTDRVQAHCPTSRVA